MLDRGNFPEEMGEPSSGETEASVKNVVREITFSDRCYHRQSDIPHRPVTVVTDYGISYCFEKSCLLHKTGVFYKNGASSCPMFRWLRAGTIPHWPAAIDRDPSLYEVACRSYCAHHPHHLLFRDHFLLTLQICEELSLWSSLNNII